jgi:streptomycin 6-kinase
MPSRRLTPCTSRPQLAPDATLATAEAGALRVWAPPGRVPAVWGYDAGAGALLLEALASEIPLSEGSPEVGLADIAMLIDGLHGARAAVEWHGVASLAERVEFVFHHWVERYRAFPEVTRAVPVVRLRRGHALARRLVGESRMAVLLHGDLHPGNVLDGGNPRGLVAIDSRLCAGEAAFDLVDWVLGPKPKA